MLLSHRIKKVLVTATAAAGILVAGAGAASAANVTVHSGDTLSSISNNNHVSLSALEQANNLTNNSVLQVGQQLNVPGTANVSNAPAQNTQTQTTTNNNAQTQSTQPQAQTQNNTQATTSNSGDSSAKGWIASHESTNSYSAQNGQYYGKYQLDKSYLNGDYSAANQERVANQYAQSRYGSWNNAQAFWQSHGWW